MSSELVSENSSEYMEVNLSSEENEGEAAPALQLENPLPNNKASATVSDITKTPRGRPRKVTKEPEVPALVKSSVNGNLKLKKGRGRPRKAVNGETSSQQLQQMSSKRPNGRPRKCLSKPNPISPNDPKPKSVLKERGRPQKLPVNPDPKLKLLSKLKQSRQQRLRKITFINQKSEAKAPRSRGRPRKLPLPAPSTSSQNSIKAEESQHTKSSKNQGRSEGNGPHKHFKIFMRFGNGNDSGGENGMETFIMASSWKWDGETFQFFDCVAPKLEQAGSNEDSTEPSTCGGLQAPFSSNSGPKPKSGRAVRKLSKKEINLAKIKSKNKFKCSECAKTFQQRRYLTTHKIINHAPVSRPRATGRGQNKTFNCGSCHKRFIAKANLDQHLHTHTKPFKCSSCSKGFANKYNLNYHAKKCIPSKIA